MNYYLNYESGVIGEKLTEQELYYLPAYHYILKNIYIPKNNNETTEIDILLISTSGLYIIESKNFNGWIFGNENQKLWTQVIKGGYKYTFYNPIWQNETHRKYIRTILPNIDPNYIYSFIAFSPLCEFKNVFTNHPEENNTYLIKRNYLNMRISDHILKNQNKLSIYQVNAIYNFLLPYTNVPDYIKYQHIKNIQQNYQ